FCSFANRSMISPYGAAGAAVGGGAATTGGGASASGSGYGTSSGVMRAIVAGSHTISPPARSTSTIASPSARWPFTDMLRPDEKNTSSARTGTAMPRTAQAATTVNSVLCIRLRAASILTDSRTGPAAVWGLQTTWIDGNDTGRGGSGAGPYHVARPYLTGTG